MTQNLVYTEPPPVSADIPLRIYSNPICPFVQRVRLLAAAKGIKTEEIDVHLKLMPNWYKEKINPVGKVPTIEHNGHLIRESLIAFDYIDEVFPGGSYWPEDPYRRAMARLFVNDYGNDFIPNYYKHYGDEVEESHSLKVVDFVDKIEQVLKRHAEHAPGLTPFLGGVDGKPRAVDFLVWPWLERLIAVMLLNGKLGSLITKEKFSRFFEYVENMKKDEAVKQSYLPPEAHLAFIKSVRSGTHDYGTVDLKGTGITIYTRKED